VYNNVKNEELLVEDLSDSEIINNLSYDKQIIQKQEYLQQLWKNREVLPFLAMDNPCHYRYKVVTTFGYDKRKKEIVAGMYKPKTHFVVVKGDREIIEEQELLSVSKTVHQMMIKYKMMPYDEDRQQGFVRHILMRKGMHTKEILLVMVVSSLIFPGKNNFVKEMVKKHPNIKSIVLNENRRRTSIVLGEKEKVIYGSGYIYDSLCGSSFRVSSKSFYQVNPQQTEILYQRAIELAKLQGNETLLDAYCGIGTIGIIASKQVKKVIGVELNKEAINDAIYNSKLNKCTNIRFFNNDASVFIAELAKRNEKVDVVIMDPPRSGSNEQFLSALCTLKPKKVVYISCGPESQVRDVKYLLAKGYKVMSIQGVDMFPYTSHTEAIVLLQR